ncbi:Protein of unknown function [Propionibacterium freudenreichii]|nr:Protein of unknown function [Propionibacterium freudenreichii]CEG97199.1 Protein of unknown function [Propionibacterium freudenreichii]
MSTRTAAPPAVASTISAAPTSPDAATLGARLAAVSRQAQGLDSVVSDPAVLAELQELCAAPRPTRRVLGVRREGPAP